MQVALIRKLSELGVIRQNTEIDAYYMGIDLSGKPIARVRGTFLVQSVSIAKDGVSATFGGASIIDGGFRKIKADDILMIDGMPVARLASIYGINESGDSVKQGKRRGRRPRDKNQIAA